MLQKADVKLVTVKHKKSRFGMSKKEDVMVIKVIGEQITLMDKKDQVKILEILLQIHNNVNDGEYDRVRKIRNTIAKQN